MFYIKIRVFLINYNFFDSAKSKFDRSSTSDNAEAFEKALMTG